MSEKNPTHTAVHAIQYLDKDGNTKTINAKSQFVASDVLDADNVKALTERGSIKKITKEEREAVGATSAKQAGADKEVKSGGTEPKA